MIITPNVEAESIVLSSKFYQQQKSVGGTVVDEQGVGLPGVSMYSWNEADKGQPWYVFDGNYLFPDPWKFEDNKRLSVNTLQGTRDFIVYQLAGTYLLATDAFYQDGISNTKSHLNISI